MLLREHLKQLSQNEELANSKLLTIAAQWYIMWIRTRDPFWHSALLHKLACLEGSEATHG